MTARRWFPFLVTLLSIAASGSILGLAIQRDHHRQAECDRRVRKQIHDAKQSMDAALHNLAAAMQGAPQMGVYPDTTGRGADSVWVQAHCPEIVRLQRLAE